MTRTPAEIQQQQEDKQNAEEGSDGDSDAYMPPLPPDMVEARDTGSSYNQRSNPTKTLSGRVVGPSLPSRSLLHDANAKFISNNDEEDEDEVGPQPLPAGTHNVQKGAVEEFLEREERRNRLAAEEALKPKVLKREEWMLVPPTSSELLGSLDPTKLKARQFSRSTAPAKKQDSSLWTETPAERQQRLADEVLGRKRRATEDIPVGEDDTEEMKRRKKDDEAIRHGVDEYTRKVRGPALVQQHAVSEKADGLKNKDAAIWDHSRDMSIGGRLMEDGKRNQLIREAKGLDNRFGRSSGGTFL